MNITGWAFTIIFSFLTIIKLTIDTAAECACSNLFKHYDTKLYRCSDGKLYGIDTVTDSNPKGFCEKNVLSFLTSASDCFIKDKCITSFFLILKSLLIFSLPFLVDIQTRLIAHGVLNLIQMRHNTLAIEGTIDMICLGIFLCGAYLLHWDILNGDGFLGPIKRARSRDKAGKFNAAE